MKRCTIMIGLACMLAIPGARAEEIRKFEIDPVHSTATFTVRHLYTRFTGRFNMLRGTVAGNPDDLSSLTIVGEIDTASVDTANDRRDAHLRNPDFFDAPNFPQARFESVRITLDEDDPQAATVVGRLTLRGTTREVTARLEFGGYGADHRDGRRLGLRISGTLSRSAYGVSYNSTLPNGMTVLGDEVAINVAIQAIEIQPDRE